MRLDDVFENNSLQDLQLHDEASRGPWGSLMLLVSRKKLLVSSSSYQKHINQNMFANSIWSRFRKSADFE